MGPQFVPAGLAGAAADKESIISPYQEENRCHPVDDFPIPQRSSRRPGPWNTQQSGGIRPPNIAPKSRPPPSSDKQALQLAQRALEKTLGEGGDRVAEMTVTGQSVSQGITVDLSHNNLYSLPDEAIDIINHNIERLALSHNRLSTIPPRLSLCTSLRYLNARNNSIEVFPPVLYKLECLEILDLSRNRIQALPDDIAKMTSLKVLAAQKNAIEDIPPCIAEMTALLALKIEGNPLNPMLKQIIDAHSHEPVPKGVRDNEGADVAVTAQIKQFLRYEARPAMARAASERSLGSGEEVDAFQHSSKRSRAGRFPIKVHGANDPTSRSSPFPSKSHSKALSLHNNALWSPGTIPLALDERERSQSTSDVLWTPDPRDVHSQANRPGVTVNKRFGVQQLPQLPTTDRFSQHLRGLSLSAAMSPSAQLPEPKDRPSSSPEEMLDVIPICQSNTQHDPLLDMARTVYFSIHRLHWLVQALSSLTSDGSYKRSSLEMVVYNANLHLSELGRQIQNYATQADQSHNRRRNAKQIRRACTILIKAYIPICSQICRSIDILVERAEPRFIHDLISLLYTSTMGLRAEFLRPLQNHGAFDQTIKHMPATKQQRRRKPGSKRGLFVRTPVSGQSMGHYTDGSLTPRCSPWTPLLPTPVPSLNGEHELLDQLYDALRRLCQLIPETLPAINRRFLTTFDNMKGQRTAPHVIETWWSAVTACSRVIDLSETLSNSLSSIRMKGPLSVSFRDLCYRLIDAWTAFGDILKSSKSLFGLDSDSKKGLQQIQQAVKETMNRLMAVSPTTAATPVFPQPPTTLPSIPLTPQQASLGPAIQATVSFSP
ncbi:hypothetical protein CEP51_014042 [Fusarium floridanum]|uniref:Disease resistance R13L4/SHOC-2-like LRR domain-containing protein n=1 Tax=Fusarium floridanum TaxID=1325733 RepID=A0A428Q049_9HYPO|nr:hypothetical protein CEP51_014042 [Fusarium floridanum]